MQHGIGRLACGRLAQQIHGLVVAPGMKGDDAEEVQRVGLVRREIERAPVGRLGLDHAAGAVVRNALFYCPDDIG